MLPAGVDVSTILAPEVAACDVAVLAHYRDPEADPQAFAQMVFVAIGAADDTRCLARCREIEDALYRHW